VEGVVRGWRGWRVEGVVRGWRVGAPNGQIECIACGYALYRCAVRVKSWPFIETETGRWA
jgi:hypothetical protein